MNMKSNGTADSRIDVLLKEVRQKLRKVWAAMCKFSKGHGGLYLSFG